MRRPFKAIPLAMSILLGLPGCAYSTVDANGTRRMYGLMSVTLPQAHLTKGADVVRIRAVGLSATNTQGTGGQVTLGYSDTIIAAVRNDTIVSAGVLRGAVEEND